jgi:hypothetical protein
MSPDGVDEQVGVDTPPLLSHRSRPTDIRHGLAPQRRRGPDSKETTARAEQPKIYRRDCANLSVLSLVVRRGRPRGFASVFRLINSSTGAPFCTGKMARKKSRERVCICNFHRGVVAGIIASRAFWGAGCVKMGSSSRRAWCSQRESGCKSTSMTEKGKMTPSGMCKTCHLAQKRKAPGALLGKNSRATLTPAPGQDDGRASSAASGASGHGSSAGSGADKENQCPQNDNTEGSQGSRQRSPLGDLGGNGGLPNGSRSNGSLAAANQHRDPAGGCSTCSLARMPCAINCAGHD